MKAAKLRRSAKNFCYEVASGKRDFAGELYKQLIIKQCAYDTALFWILYEPYVSVCKIAKQQPPICGYGSIVEFYMCI